jgi:hypothetical protein
MMDSRRLYFSSGANSSSQDPGDRAPVSARA